MFYIPGLAVQTWMHKIPLFDPIPVIIQNFEDQSDSLPKYLMEAADITDIVMFVMSKYGKEGIYAVLSDFGSGEIQTKPFG